MAIGDAVIGALRVALSADTASLEDGLMRASKTVEKFGSKMDGLGRLITGALAGISVGAIAHSIQKTIDSMDQMGKTAQKIAIPVGELSKLRIAAELSDVSMETLTKGVSKLSAGMVDFQNKGTTPAAAALRYFGVTSEDVSKGSTAVLAKISDSASRMGDSFNKTAAINAIFGQRMGRELIPLLNEGGKGFQYAAETAKAFGLVLDTQTTQQAQDFNDRMKEVGFAVEGFFTQIAKLLLPKLVELSTAFVKWLKDSKAVDVAVMAVGRAIAFMADNLKVFLIPFATFLGLGAIQAISAMISAFLALGIALGRTAIAITLASARMLIFAAGIIIVVGAAALLTGQLDPMLKKIEDLTAELSKDPSGTIAKGLETLGLNARSLTGDMSGLGAQTAKTANEIKNSLGGAAFNPNLGKEANKFNQELLKIQFKTRELRGDFEGLAPGFTEAAIRMGLIKDNAIGFDGAVTSLTPKMQILNQALLGLAGAKVTQENLTSVQQFEDEMTKLNLLVNSGSITWDTWARAAQKAAEQAGMSLSKLSDDMIGGWRDLFQALGKENEKFFKMGQALAIVMAIINTAEGVTKALAQGGFFGIAMAAAVAAKGLAQIITIKQQKFTKAAGGGSFMVPGGKMGVDTKLIPMALAPGERVDITPASKVGGGANGFLELSPIRADEFLTGDMVRELVFKIDQWVKDGGTGIRFSNLATARR